MIMRNREKDELSIPEGFYFEPYTPTAGRIVSPSMGVPIEFAKMYLSEDADVTFKDYAGNLVTDFPLSKGGHSFLVREIISVSTGTVAIVHNGTKASTV